MVNTLARFTSEINGHESLLNLDTERFAWVKEVSFAEMQDIVKEWEKIRLNLLWKDLECPFDQDRRYIRGFVTDGTARLRYFKAGVIKQCFGVKSGRNLGFYVHSQPLEDQIAVLRSLKPTTLEEFEKVCGVHGARTLFPANLKVALTQAGSAACLVDTMQTHFATNTVPRHYSSPYRELLMLLRAKGLLLFPAAYNEWTSGGPVRWSSFQCVEYAGALYPLLDEVARHLVNVKGRPTEKTGIGLSMIASMSITCIEDLSRQLIDATEEVFYNKKIDTQATSYWAARRPGHVRSAAVGIRQMWNRHFPSLAFETTRTQLVKMDSSLMRTRGEYRWVALANPTMHAWVEPLAAFITERQGGHQKSGPIADLNWFCDYLLSLDSPPEKPEDIDRHVHIHDPTLKNSDTLMLRLRNANLTGKRQYRVLRITREFYSWYADWLHRQGKADLAQSLKNPVTELDRVIPDRPATGTHRMALPSWVLRELRRTLTENDYAMPKAAFKADWVPVFDMEKREVHRIWWPGVAVALAILLDLPLRSHQVRWLDCGEFDEIYYDPVLEKDVKNLSSHAIPGRREFCLRLLRDPVSQTQWLGMYVNTNKTALYDGRSPVGYEIPYVSQETASLIDKMMQWNKRYQPPLGSLITYQHEGLGRSAFAKVDAARLPRIAPLLRDPKNPQSHVPVSRDKMARLWVKVLHETEKRVRVERGLPDFELTKLDEKGNRTWKVDLHTLRVSGISAMIENGVPLEVVSQFVAGHATLVMTLWYTKFAPAKIRAEIERASLQAHTEADFVGGHSFAEHVEEFSPFLLSKGASQRDDGMDAAFLALKEHTGIWSIHSDGICPGTSCSTGGEYQPGAAEYAPVVGGQRCGLCRYWITGPAFMLGQMAAVNSLAYQIRKKGLSLKEERDRLIDADDANKSAKARHIRDRIEFMERELAIDLAEWQARYAYAMASSELIDEYKKTRGRLVGAPAQPVPMLTANSADELRLTLAQTDEFILLEHVTQMAEFMPGFQNREAMQDKHVLLAQLLAANGIPATYLVRLNQEQRDAAANLMTATLLQFVETHDVRQLVAGEKQLDEIAGLGAAIRELAEPIMQPHLNSGAGKVIPLKKVSS